MSENINFIPANELPEAEGSEVSVLCVENGELKLKSGASLGGGAKQYDLAVAVTIHDEDNVVLDGKIVSGSYDAVMSKLDACELPCVFVKETIIDPNGYITTSAWELDVINVQDYTSRGDPCGLFISGNFAELYLLSDGTFSFGI